MIKNICKNCKFFNFYHEYKYTFTFPSGSKTYSHIIGIKEPEYENEDNAKIEKTVDVQLPYGCCSSGKIQEEEEQTKDWVEQGAIVPQSHYDNDGTILVSPNFGCIYFQQI
jgi:hypothetical protein